MMSYLRNWSQNLAKLLKLFLKILKKILREHAEKEQEMGSNGEKGKKRLLTLFYTGGVKLTP